MEHIAFILDGNRRWARAHGLPTFEGHRRGYETMKTMAREVFARGIPYMTVYAFSTENWKRAEDEVSYLMGLVVQAFTNDLSYFADEGIRLRIFGLREGLSAPVLEGIERAERETAGNTHGQLNVCFNYGGRAELVRAAQQLVREGVSADAITEDMISARLWTAGLPDPDLVIRTSGEHRLSNFLPWQSAYSELLFLEKHWPDMTEGDLDAALETYASRQRRFGV